MLTPSRLAIRSPHLRLALLLCALAAPLVLGGRAQAGVTVVMQRGASTISTLYIDGDKMRAENPGAANRAAVVIIDAAGKKFLMVNDADKSYFEMTEAGMKARRAEMDEKMKSLPPEQRQRIEQMLGKPGDKPPELKFEKTGVKKTVNGFSCEVYRVLEGAMPKEEDCLAPWGAGILQRSDFAGLRKFAEDMAKSMGATGRQMFEQFDKYPGFPVTRHPLEPGKGEDEQLKSVKRGSIPASMFAVPAGFTKRDSPMGMGSPGMGSPPRGNFRPLPPPK
jgi:Domain of unknown function (DUF4412)